MSQPGDSRSVKLNNMPKFIVRKDKLTNFTIIKQAGNANLIKKLKTLSEPMKEDLIYCSYPGDFLNSDCKVLILNQLNLVTKSSHTVARFVKSDRVVNEKTSENISNLIGRENYDLLFTTLCSVISQELKIRAILALLTTPKKNEVSKDSDNFMKSKHKIMIDSSCQTEESSFDTMMKTQPRRRVKRQFPAPYVVTDAPEKLTKVVVNPSDFRNFASFNPVSIKTECQEPPMKIEKVHDEYSYPKSMELSADSQETISINELPVLNGVEFDEDSKDSIGGFSQISVNTTELLKAPLSLINSITRVTESPKETVVDWANSTCLKMLDGTDLHIPVKIEDEFHVATPEILKFVPPEYRRKLLWYQLYMDWKYCLRRNEDGYLALHTAVINNDVDLVRRQCLVLNSREESVDIPTGDNVSALQLSILGGSPASTRMLLDFGADPLATDDEYRTCFHLAAEADAEQLKTLVAYCQANPLKVLQENDELWRPELASKPKEYQADYLLKTVCSMPDNQGYTPLMVASKLGRFANVETLLKAAPTTVNVVMPNSGNSPLYLAVGSACHDCVNRGNKSKVSDDFKKTIELLVENGADPSKANHSGADVNTLLTDFSVGELSMLIAGKMTYVNTRDSGARTSTPQMLIKEEDGTMNAIDIKAYGIKSTESKAVKEKVKNIMNANKDVLKGYKNTDEDKNTGKDIKNTVKVQRANSLLKPVKTVRIGIKKNVNLNCDSSVENSVNSGPSSSKEVQNVSKKSKFVILENKVIKSFAKQAPPQFHSSFEKFVSSSQNNSPHFASPVSKKPRILKRKSSDETDGNKIIQFQEQLNHPRVKTLRTEKFIKKDLNVLINDPDSLKKDSNVPKSSLLSSPLILKTYSRPSTSKDISEHVNAENKPTSSKMT